jgi:hypothetical protein
MVTFDLPRVVRVVHAGDHRLRLRFSDGLEGTVDLRSALRGPVLEALRDPAVFAQARLEGATVVWPNGADWAPESLHARLVAETGAGAPAIDDGLSGGSAHAAGMPEISRFFGIVVRMFYDDHSAPHFHAVYGEYSVAMEIDGDGIRGRFPPSRLLLLFEWRDRHRAELMANWQRLRDGRSIVPIEPLD